jgi:hypothetical protein
MATDALMATASIEEALSEAYLRALAGAAGYTVSKPSLDVDGVDLTIDAGGDFRPRLDVQLKASVNLSAKDGKVSYFCPKRNHQLLRLPTQVPRILVLYHLPKDQRDWLIVSPNEMILRHRAYWMSLRGEPETENETGCTVHVPEANRLDIASLTALMHQSRTGTL